MIIDTIQLKAQSLSEQTITEQLQGILELHQGHMVYSIEFYCRELSDDTGIWEDDVYRAYSTMILRSHMIGTTIARNHKEDRWYLTIRTTGPAIEHYCDSEQEAREMARRLQVWLLG
jgi:hypothetical protein